MPKNIVILGAGFGGIRAALDLDRKLRTHSRDLPAGKAGIATPRQGGARNDSGGWRVVLVDRNAYHVYYPRLYEMVMPQGARSKEQGASCCVSIKEILKGTRVEFVQGEVKGVDCKGRTVKMCPSPGPMAIGPPSPAGRGEGEGIQYDYLIVALGADADYFGIPGLKEYACTLKSLKDAEVIREQVGEFLKEVQDPHFISPLARGRKRGLSIVIGGAGATGVEVASELAYLFRNIPRGQWSITLVEALPRILSMFPNALSQYAHQRLEALGVQLMLDTCIKEVVTTARHPEVSAEGSRAIKNNGILRAAQNDSVKVEVVLAPRPLKPGETETQLVCDFLPEHEKRISADLLLWAGGVRANPLLEICGMAVDHKGRLEVDEHLQVKGMDQVFAIGDNATLLDPTTKQTVPATAQAAIVQGKIVAVNIASSMQGIPFKLYPFPKFPAIVPLAGKDGVALIGNRVIYGLPSWFLRKAADWRYYVTIVGWSKAIKLGFFK